MLTTIVTGALLSAALIQQTDTVIAVRPGTRLDVDNFAGEVVVRTWSRNEMRIVADHSSRSEVEILRSGSTVRLRLRSRRGPGSVDYEITVPVSTSVDINGTFTSADIEGVQGEVRVETTQGDIAVKGGRGFVSLHSTQGDVELAGAQGRVNVQSVTGDVRVTDVSGSVYAETVTGSIILDGIESGSVEATTTSGEVRYDGTIEDDGRYSFSTHSGDVIAAVPQGINVTISVSTFSGEFETAFPVTLTQTRGSRFRFTLGNGSARMDLESFSGDVELTARGRERRRR